VIWGIIIFSEQHTLWIWMSVMVMLLGLVLVSPDDTDVSDTAIAETSS
jgi:drug/metabolite transporter (DMT)-like permease